MLEVPFRVDFGPGLEEEDIARIADSWASCTVPADETAQVVVADTVGGPSPAAAGDLSVRASSVARLEESLTSTLTIAAIGRRRRDLLMLHACGVADERGRVLAFVAASGTGKTTIARALARRFGYVTDETVGVTPEGAVLPYPKPLSVKPLTGTAPKAQLAPAALGLLPVPVAALSLAGVILLDRRGDVAEPFLEEVDPVDAIDDLVPQTSYLSARSRPITGLVQTLRELGGVTRLVYSEAEGVEGLVEGLFDAPRRVASAIWREVVPLPLEPSGDHDRGAIRQAPVDDALLLPDGEVVVFCGNRLVRLSGVGPAIWRLAGPGIDQEELVAAVVAELGSAPPGVDPSLVVGAALDELIGLGVVARARSEGPTRVEVRG